MEKMKIGIIGGYGHACIRPHPNADFAWACDGYDEEALKKAKATENATTFASMDNLLEKFQPDVVYIGTIYGRNGTLAIEAMEKGYDIVCEKPLATDENTLARLRALTAGGERRIIGEFAMRWSPPLLAARDIIQSGEIGETVQIQAQKTYKFGASRPDFYKSRDLFGGIIPWVASHAIDYAAWATGLEYKSVTASHGNRCFPEYPEMEDHAAMFFEMSNGAPCLMTADFLRPGGAPTHADDGLRVTGSKGVVEVRNQTITLINSDGTKSWNPDGLDSLAVKRAQDLVDAALGRATTVINTAECLHITEAALVARNSADLAQRGTPTVPLTISGNTSEQSS